MSNLRRLPSGALVNLDWATIVEAWHHNKRFYIHYFSHNDPREFKDEQDIEALQRWARSVPPLGDLKPGVDVNDPSWLSKPGLSESKTK